MVEEVHEANHADGTEQGGSPGQGRYPAQAVVPARTEPILLSHGDHETGNYVKRPPRRSQGGVGQKEIAGSRGGSGQLAMARDARPERSA